MFLLSRLPFQFPSFFYFQQLEYNINTSVSIYPCLGNSYWPISLILSSCVYGWCTEGIIYSCYWFSIFSISINLIVSIFLLEKTIWFCTLPTFSILMMIMLNYLSDSSIFVISKSSSDDFYISSECHFLDFWLVQKILDFNKKKWKSCKKPDGKSGLLHRSENLTDLRVWLSLC